MIVSDKKIFIIHLLTAFLLSGHEIWASDRIIPSGACTNNVIMPFPTSGPEQTRWDICFEALPANGLVITQALFRRSPGSSQVQVLSDARIAEIFVPYHPGSPRFHDVSDFNFPLLTLKDTDCPASAGGTLIGNSQVCKEVRDRGVAWKDDSLVRRGEELVLWSVVDASNYNYIIQWVFRDDGAILGEVGSTGPKLGGADDTTGHMHTFSWRLDIDLNGSDGDSVQLTRHSEPLPGLSATDHERLITTESGLVWKPRKYNTLEISDSSLQNDNGRTTSYELVPLRSGTARHNEAFTKKDFWVTRFKEGELLARNLPSFLTNESVVNTDVVIWYTVGAHHENGMRDEDRDTVPVKWVGFELSPKNLFNDTPLYP